MNGFRSFGNILVILLIFTLMIAVIGGLAKGAAAGVVDPELVAAGVTGFILILVVGAFVAVIRSFRLHKDHMKQASSADILADLIAMKDEEKKNGKEDGSDGE